jgi:hypothetical protein
VKHVDYGVLTFDGEGKLDKEAHMRSLHLAADIMSIYSPKREGEGVIDARGRFAQRQHEHEYRWQPTPEIEEALSRAIFGLKDGNGPKNGKRSLLRLV